MACKFDDINKPAKDVVNEDYQTSGFQLKAKQGTSWNGSVATTTVDLFDPKASTGAKLSWKFPKPFGCTAISVDKFEVDKKGKLKMEASSNRVHKDVKMELKSDLSAGVDQFTAGATYTGMKDARIQVDFKNTYPQDISAEVVYKAHPMALIGLKAGMSNIVAPDVCVRLMPMSGISASLFTQNAFQLFTASACYDVPASVMADMKIGGICKFGRDAKGNEQMQGSLGLVYKVLKGTTVKAKVEQDQSVCASVKHELKKGFTVLSGVKYSTSNGNMSYGVQLSIE